MHEKVDSLPSVHEKVFIIIQKVRQIIVKGQTISQTDQVLKLTFHIIQFLLNWNNCENYLWKSWEGLLFLVLFLQQNISEHLKFMFNVCFFLYIIVSREVNSCVDIVMIQNKKVGRFCETVPQNSTHLCRISHFCCSMYALKLQNIWLLYHWFARHRWSNNQMF